MPALLQAQTAAAAAPAAAAYAPRTGDAWIDRALADIGAYAARYPDSFVDEMARYLGVSRDDAQALAARPDWRAGDAYFACALAKSLAVPCGDVAQAWSSDHAKGWRGVARGVGARPGGAEYAAVRAAIRASYAHWARPLPP